MTKDTNAIVRSQFGVAAPDYATSEVHAKGESLARIVELAVPQKPWHVLDVATGAGHMAAAFAPLVTSIVASDITDEMLIEAGKLAASRNLINMTTAPAEAAITKATKQSCVKKKRLSASREARFTEFRMMFGMPEL